MTNTSTTKRQRRMAREPKTEGLAGQKSSDASPSLAPDEAIATEQKEPSKTAKVLSLLKRAEGATLAELVGATGWLPHTTRAALTGLKKKGHEIERTKAEGISRYSIVEAPAQ